MTVGLVINPYGLGAPPFDPIAGVAWHAAYWASGPEFLALGVADAGAVTTWPDEKGTRDLTQATASKKPTLRTASAGMGSKPVLEFDGTADAIKISTGALTQPNEVVIVGRYRSLNGGYLVDGGASSQGHVVFASATQWSMYAGGTTRSGGTSNTTKHLMCVLFSGVSSEFRLDGSVVVTGDPGTQQMTGVTAGAQFDGASAFGAVDIAFIGVKDSALTTQERADLLAWSQAFYGTP